MWFLLGFLAVAAVEILLLIKLGGAIGLWLLLGWIGITGFLGVILLRGIAMLGSASLGYNAEAFHDPNSPMAHRGLVLIAGLMLVLPGPLTDTFGILLLFAPLRRVIIRLVARRLVAIRTAATTVVTIDGEWRDTTASGKSGGSDGKLPGA